MGGPGPVHLARGGFMVKRSAARCTNEILHFQFFEIGFSYAPDRERRIPPLAYPVRRTAARIKTPHGDQICKGGEAEQKPSTCLVSLLLGHGILFLGI